MENVIERRKETYDEQKPFAMVISCSDSRVPVEEIFNVGVGEVFVLRTAGNVLDDLGIATVAYAVEHLHVPVIIVMGHERCGAVTAAVEGNEEEVLKPIIDRISSHITSSDVEEAVWENAEKVAEEIRLLPFVKGTKVVVAKYFLKDGRVEFKEDF